MSTDNKPLIEVHGLVKDYKIGKRGSRTILRAVDNVDFKIYRGRALGVVGESGSGKSTVASILAKLLAPTSGSVKFDGVEIDQLAGPELKNFRRRVQTVFQDPFSSLNPKMTVLKSISEPLVVHKIGTKEERIARVYDLLKMVGLEPSYAERYPHQLSGGQAQRVSIARALALQPEFIILDEPISSLDLSIQAQILNLLKELQAKFQLTYLFIGHDLGTVAFISDDICVMESGKIVEMGSVDEIFQRPKHEYTKKLLGAVLDPTKDLGRFLGVGK
jgi:ABC-type oligopeptide transport system ATPase subunit